MWWGQFETDQEILQLSRWYRCNYICHKCFAHKDTFMESPAKLLDKRRCTRDEFFQLCIKPGDQCSFGAYSEYG